MRFNTGNPVEPSGSSDPRDLYDTAAIADLLVNGPLAEYLSRLGVPLKSWRGIMQQVTDYLIAQSYESIYLAYAAGVVVLRQTQLVQKDGELYRVKNAVDIPLTLTGVWATDALKLQAVGDAVLRQVLASSSGSTKIGDGAGTVATALRAIEAVNSTQTSQIQTNTDAIAAGGNLSRQFSNTLEPAVVDLHFGTLQGVGWSASEPGNIVAHTVTASTLNTITLNNVTGLYPGQLFSYQATDGDYYTGVIKQIGTLTVHATLPLPAPVAIGAQLYNFYRDDAHANTYGFNAVVDDALRQLTAKRLSRVEYRAKDNSVWIPLLAATLTTQTASIYANPGAGAVGERAIKVASSAVNAGCISSAVALVGGDYVTAVVVNPGERDGGFTGILDISVDEITADGLTYTIAYRRLSPTWQGSSNTVELAYSVRAGSAVRVRVISPNAGPWNFFVGQLTHSRVGGYLNNLNRGKHVLLGDSWFTSGADFHNRLIAKLNKATVLSAGVPGNRASQLISRFGTDVVPLKPDFVWVMVGTNDYYASVSNGDFDQQINQLRCLIQAIGAQPIFFNATVGAIAPTLGGGDQLVKSRSYALNVNYTGQELPSNGPGAVQRNFTASELVTVPASNSVIVAVSPGQTRLPAYIRFLCQSLTGMTLSIEYASTADGAGGVDISTFSGVSIAKDTLAARANTDLRFIAIRATNATGSPITARILVDICWQQSLV